MSYRKKHIKPKIKGLRKRKKFFQRPVFWFLILGIIVIGSALYVFLFLPEFQITDIAISGNTTISTDAIKNIIERNIDKKIFTASFLHISSKSIFTANTKNISKDLQDNFLEINNIKVQKTLPSTIAVTISERQNVAILCKSQLCALIDTNGDLYLWDSHFAVHVSMINALYLNMKNGYF